MYPKHTEVTFIVRDIAEPRDGAVHWKIQVATTEGDKPRNISGSYFCSSSINGYEDLFLSDVLWADRDNLDTIGTLEFRDIYSANVEQLEMRAKALRQVSRKLGKIYDECGNPESFAEWVVRVAQAMGVKRIFFVEGAAPGWSYDQMDFAICPLGAARAKLQRMRANWIDRYAKVKAAA